jgi:hypothetical protein
MHTHRNLEIGKELDVSSVNALLLRLRDAARELEMAIRRHFNRRLFHVLQVDFDVDEFFALRPLERCLLTESTPQPTNTKKSKLKFIKLVRKKR